MPLIIELKGAVTPNVQDTDFVAPFNPATINEFTPVSYDIPQPVSFVKTETDISDWRKFVANEVLSDSAFEPFNLNGMSQALPTTPYHPYIDDTTNITNTGAYFQAQPTFSAPAQPVR